MQRRQLREYLDELNSALSDIDGTEEDKAKLASLIAEIELQLNEPVLVTGEPESLASQVDNMITAFEQDHPNVAGILNNIMLTLSNMGV